ncbi:MAG: glycoside hydrolase family 19 protein [Flavobacteriales bacterium]|nr:glycoside hydrolase family 19 protein [Flavobacteriales bacterium]
MTLKQLEQLLRGNDHISEWHNSLSMFLPEYEIDTTNRMAAFIAQCSHESGEFTTLKENLNYRWQSLRKVFPKYFFNDAIAQKYASLPNKQEAIANRIYANRMGNGPEESGDGFKYRGRGLIQLTGYQNYKRFADSLGITPEEASEYLETFEGATESACWFWSTNNLNQWADAGDMITLTKRINGGTNGLEDRIQHYEHALHVLEN